MCGRYRRRRTTHKATGWLKDSTTHSPTCWPCSSMNTRPTGTSGCHTYCLHTALRPMHPPDTLPFYMLHGFEPRYPIDVLQNDQLDYANAHEWTQQAVGAIKAAHAAAQQNLRKVDTKLATINIRRKPLRSYQAGDLVMIYHPKGDDLLNIKLQRLWRGPYEVLRQCGPLTYTVRALPQYVPKQQRKRRMTVNVLRMKPYIGRAAELQVEDPTTPVV